MSLYEDKSHVTKMKELERSLKATPKISRGERERILAKAKREIYSSSGMSKDEWLKKVVKPLEKNEDPKEKISREDARRLKKLAESE